MFSWLENLDKKRWWNMLIIVGFIFAILFGMKLITIIPPIAGFLFSIGLLFVGIGEGANHQKIPNYETGEYAWIDPINNKKVASIPAKIQKGYIYKRKPVFIGIVFDVFGILLMLIGLYKLL